MSRSALFLDRDNVINVDHGYVARPEDFDFIEGIFDLVLAANRAGSLVSPAQPKRPNKINY